jgi:hypothetical protein
MSGMTSLDWFIVGLLGLLAVEVAVLAGVIALEWRDILTDHRARCACRRFVLPSGRATLPDKGTIHAHGRCQPVREATP